MATSLLVPLALLTVAPVAAQPVIQPLPDPAAGQLAEALRTLARNPQSLEALITAGEASLRLDDLEAAAGFYARAESVAPADGRIKAGNATILLRRGNPVEALRLYAEAERMGAPMAAYSSDRGLAYDLVGDTASAQAAYWLALSLGPDDTVSRRLAISQAIGGDRAASEATLLPLLHRQDLAAFRARAFALAILGQADEAVSIAETMLPARISGRLAPYLRYMTRLTRAQQAAAANLGQFPPAEEIGRDDPAVAARAATAPAAAAAPPPPTGGADARLVPSGEPMGPSRAPAPAPGQAQPAPSGELPPVDGAEPQPYLSQPVVQPLQSTPAQPSPAQAAPAPAPQQPGLGELPPVDEAAAQPSVNVPVVQPLPEADTAPVSVPVPVPSPGPAASAPLPVRAPVAPTPVAAVAEPPAPPPAEEPDLAAAFADFAQAPRPQPSIAGAVDITTIEPRRDPPPRREPPPPPPRPSREWVQLATGRDASALAFDWRRLKREAGGALDNDRPHLAEWGDRTRLLIGPFANPAEAQAAVRALARAEVESFRFTSAEGEEVRPLD